MCVCLNILEHFMQYYNFFIYHPRTFWQSINMVCLIFFVLHLLRECEEKNEDYDVNYDRQKSRIHYIRSIMHLLNYFNIAEIFKARTREIYCNK